jgi:hypothetical protein
MLMAKSDQLIVNIEQLWEIFCVMGWALPEHIMDASMVSVALVPFTWMVSQ